jgi:hypothetical protein
MSYQSATSLPTIPRWVKGVEYSTVSTLLADFRRYIEKDAGEPVERLEVNGAMFLDDLCKFLGLEEPLRQKVLGRSAANFIKTELDATVTIPRRND